ncbi:ead/Ea22-like family protein [Pseudomonas alloputida]|uniref:ead/Ea22-like family protein n=1 Tax=Pseudomonas alloputida TaxID=1940621 RepID=UPI001E393C24|nr:ead/Ea22-like family protein [Pseudomonas alloputida]MDM3881336.1 ead/Ea22-like family protein [Pseudomonas alloputida]
MSVDKAQLKALAQRATPGQWVTEGEHINEHGHLLYAYVAHENSGMIAEAFANCRVKTDEECRANAAFIAGANPANVLALLAGIEELQARIHLAGVAGEMAVNEAVGRAATEFLAAIVKQDQLKAESEKHRCAAQDALAGQMFLRNDRDLLKVELEALRKKSAGKVMVDLDLFESLRDSALVEADQHRQSMAGYRPERQQLLDQIVEQCDRLLADATGRRDNQNLTRQEE